MTIKERMILAKSAFVREFGRPPPMMQMTFQGMSEQDMVEYMEKAVKRGIEEMPGDFPEVEDNVML